MQTIFADVKKLYNWPGAYFKSPRIQITGNSKIHNVRDVDNNKSSLLLKIVLEITETLQLLQIVQTTN